MRSPRSVKRPHTNHHTTNIRRNRGKQIKNARMRHKQWAHTLIYSPEIAEKRQNLNLSPMPVIKEVSEEERARRAEKKKEKRLTAKFNDDEIRRLELERKEREREERKQRREEEKKRQEEQDYQKWLEQQKKKEEELKKEAAERKAAEKKAAEQKKKEEAEAQAAAKKEKTKKEKKPSESEKIVTNTTVNVEKTTPTETPTAPAPKPVEEAEKKKKKKEKEPSIEKEVPVEVASAPVVESSPPVEVHHEEKQTKKKGGKGKKASESEAAHHVDQNEAVVVNDVKHVEEAHGKHEGHGKKGKKSKKVEAEPVDVANGHVAHAVVEESTHIIESAPVGDVPNGGLVQLDGEKKKGGKGAKPADEQHETTSPEPSVVTETVEEVIEKEIINEVEHHDTNGHHEEKHEEPVEIDYSTQKIKQKENKAKQASPPPHIEVPEVTVVTEETITQNESPVAEAGNSSPPIQVHEVTSTAHENGTKETIHTTTTTITTTTTTTSPASPTQFAQNVEKLVSHALKTKHDIVEIDPNVTPSNRERLYKLLPKDIIFCSGLLDSHGENYAAMAADPRNIYKENVRGIQRKIRIFKESPHYQTYLRAKEEGRSVEDILAEEGQT